MTSSPIIRAGLIAGLISFPLFFLVGLQDTLGQAAMGMRIDWEATRQHIMLYGVVVFALEVLLTTFLALSLMRVTKTEASPVVVVCFSPAGRRVFIRNRREH